MYELPEPEVWTDEDKATILLNNAFTKEEWDELADDVRSWGLDPNNIPGVDITKRETLTTQAEWEAEVREARAAIGIGVRRSA